MQILNMDLKIDVRDFPFLDAPNHESLSAVLESLKSQNIVQAEDSRVLTLIGKVLADLPVDIVVGKVSTLNSINP
jgi:HrpA-like RNA helicase